jgi:hypothetical protein
VDVLAMLSPAGLRHIPRRRRPKKQPTNDDDPDSDGDAEADPAAGLADGRDGVEAQHWSLKYVDAPGVRMWSYGEKELLTVRPDRSRFAMWRHCKGCASGPHLLSCRPLGLNDVYVLVLSLMT